MKRHFTQVDTSTNAYMGEKRNPGKSKWQLRMEEMQQAQKLRNK